VNQLAFPSEVTPQEVAREKSFGDAILLCVRAAGLVPKEVQSDLAFDKGQFARWTTGEEGIKWPKLAQLMDHCGNDAPLLWLLHNRGFDLTSLRKRETETERALRMANQRIEALLSERAVERRLLGEVLAGRVPAERMAA
jgi:hypothetical protein